MFGDKSHGTANLDFGIHMKLGGQYADLLLPAESRNHLRTAGCGGKEWLSEESDLMRSDALSTHVVFCVCNEYEILD